MAGKPKKATAEAAIGRQPGKGCTGKKKGESQQQQQQQQPKGAVAKKEAKVLAQAAKLVAVCWRISSSTPDSSAAAASSCTANSFQNSGKPRRGLPPSPTVGSAAGPPSPATRARVGRSACSRFGFWRMAAS